MHFWVLIFWKTLSGKLIDCDWRSNSSRMVFEIGKIVFALESKLYAPKPKFLEI